MNNLTSVYISQCQCVSQPNFLPQQLQQPAVCSVCAWQCYIPPDGLVEGGAEDLVVVLGEAQTGHTFAVGVLKPAQAQAAQDLPHLQQQRTHFSGGEITLSNIINSDVNTYYCETVFEDPTFILPFWAPVASRSVSWLKHMHSTASSIIMKLSWAWYFSSWFIHADTHTYTHR